MQMLEGTMGWPTLRVKVKMMKVYIQKMHVGVQRGEYNLVFGVCGATDNIPQQLFKIALSIYGPAAIFAQDWFASRVW